MGIIHPYEYQYIYYPPTTGSVFTPFDLIFFVVCFIFIAAMIALGWYFRQRTIKQLGELWFKNKVANQRREDKLYKEGRQSEKAQNKPVMTQRELNDLIIKKFMK